MTPVPVRGAVMNNISFNPLVITTVEKMAS